MGARVLVGIPAMLAAGCLLTACGGGSSSVDTATESAAPKIVYIPSLPRTKVVAEADAICAAHRRGREKLGQVIRADTQAFDAEDGAANRRALVADLNRSIQLRERELDELRALQGPEVDRAKIRGVIYVAEATLVGARTTVEAIRDGDRGRIAETEETTRMTARGRQRLAGEYGFRVCGQIVE